MSSFSKDQLKEFTNILDSYAEAEKRKKSERPEAPKKVRFRSPESTDENEGFEPIFHRNPTRVLDFEEMESEGFGTVLHKDPPPPHTERQNLPLVRALTPMIEFTKPLQKEEYLDRIEDIYARVKLFILNGRMIVKAIRSFRFDIKDRETSSALSHIKGDIKIVGELWVAKLKHLIIRYKTNDTWPIPLSDEVYGEGFYRFIEMFHQYPVNWSSLTIQKLIHDIGISHERFGPVDTRYYELDMDNLMFDVSKDSNDPKDSSTIGNINRNIETSNRNIGNTTSTIGHGIEVKESRIEGAGRGLFATRDFEKDSIITEYSGILRTQNEVQNLPLGERTHILTVKRTGLSFVIDAYDSKNIHGVPGGGFINYVTQQGLNNVSFEQVKDNLSSSVMTSQFKARFPKNMIFYKPSDVADYTMYAVALRDISAGEELYVSKGHFHS